MSHWLMIDYKWQTIVYYVYDVESYSDTVIQRKMITITYIACSISIIMMDAMNNDIFISLNVYQEKASSIL